MIDYKKIIKNQELRLKLIPLLKFIPNEPYLKFVYKIKTGKSLNLKNPVTFNEKQNWLKIHDIHPEYTDYVDKIKVREIVKEKLGEDISFPLLGVYDKYENINFDNLPNKFVIKCNHDSGSVKVITDKKNIDHKKLSVFFNNRLKRNPYWDGREYPYKNVKPKLLIEKFMVPDGETDINDYKFFCFNGEPLFLYIMIDYTSNHSNGKCSFYDMNFKQTPFQRTEFPPITEDLTIPTNFDEMKNIARKLAKGIKFARIDLYSIKDKVYFGEYTFFASGGFSPLVPDKYENYYGNILKL